MAPLTDFTRFLKPATASDLENQGDKIDECTICLRPYSAAPTATSNLPTAMDDTSPTCSHPTKLDCGHIFGHACLAHFLLSTPPAHLRCPMCRRLLDPLESASKPSEEDEDARDLRIALAHIPLLDLTREHLNNAFCAALRMLDEPTRLRWCSVRRGGVLEDLQRVAEDLPPNEAEAPMTPMTVLVDRYFATARARIRGEERGVWDEQVEMDLAELLEHVAWWFRNEGLMGVDLRDNFGLF